MKIVYVKLFVVSFLAVVVAAVTEVGATGLVESPTLDYNINGNLLGTEFFFDTLSGSALDVFDS